MISLYLNGFLFNRLPKANLWLNKKVLLHECKRHTAHCTESTRCIWGWGTYLCQGDTYSSWGTYPGPGSES